MYEVEGRLCAELPFFFSFCLFFFSITHAKVSSLFFISLFFIFFFSVLFSFAGFLFLTLAIRKLSVTDRHTYTHTKKTAHTHGTNYALYLRASLLFFFVVDQIETRFVFTREKVVVLSLFLFVCFVLV